MKRRAKTIVHVNQFIIRNNTKNNKRDPVLTIKHKNKTSYAHEAHILDDDGNIIAKIVYRPDKPLSCGARVWVETNKQVKLLNNEAK